MTAMRKIHMGARTTDAVKPDRGISGDSPLSISELPEINCLQAGLESVLEDQGFCDGKLAILSRENNTFVSTFPSEIVTCRIGNDPEVRLFFKYSADRENEAYGHRGGVGYEAKVYSRLLNSLDISTANLRGIYRSPDGNNTWLVLDYLEDSVRVTKVDDPEAMAKAARWIGRFHTLCSRRIGDPALSLLIRYNPDYYRGWVSRTQQMVRQAGFDSGWLHAVCNRIDEVIGVLCDAPQTIIHGEYYVKNILLQHGLLYPVDWESTAVGSGMIDLATLTEGWPPDVTRQLVREYQRSRWPEGAPHDFNRVLSAARIYVQFRWLGDPQARLPEWACYLEALHEHAEEMGLI
jgi:thiamine kinase-like enzyme